MQIDPGRTAAVILDLDGVVTDTAAVHASAWRRLFDDVLAARPPAAGEDRSPFSDEDYRRHVDGRDRYDGVARFLAARGIRLPRGRPSDPEDRETVCGLGNRKNRYFLERLERDGVRVFASSVDLLRALRRAGVRTGLVTASRNGARVVEAAGVSGLFDTQVDGVVADRLRLRGKPAPDLFLEACRRLGVAAARTVIVEDAAAGVTAGRRAGAELVVGVDRTGTSESRDRLAAAGADVVVTDLTEVAVVVR